MRSLSGSARLAVVVCLSLAAATGLAGCSLGYVNLRPGENSALYQSLFDDVITSYDEPHWLWIRGVLSLDLDGDGKMEEEAVLATIQKGYHASPGPIEAAFLVACRIGPAGERIAMARTLLFERNPVANAPQPVNDIGVHEDLSLTHLRAQAIPDKLSLAESVAVYFWGDGKPTNAWYACYRLNNGALVKTMETALWQDSPGILVANLDKSLESRLLGYQLIMGAEAVPNEVAGKIGPLTEVPLWGHVYSRDAEGIYHQADERYGDHYKRLLPAWNQYYLKALMLNLPPADLAWLEYHLGLLNYYLGDRDMADDFLGKAEKGAAADILSAAIAKTRKYIAEKDAEKAGGPPKAGDGGEGKGDRRQ